MIMDDSLITSWNKIHYCTKTGLLKVGSVYAKDFIYRQHNDIIPDGMMVEYIDNNIAHNHISNLRLKPIQYWEKVPFPMPTSAAAIQKFGTIRGPGRSKGKPVRIDGAVFHSQYAASKFCKLTAVKLHLILTGKRENDTGKIIELVE